LAYGSKCGNHTQTELSIISVFLNKSQSKLLVINQKDAEGRVITNVELQRRCRLMEPLDLLSCRRLSLVAKVTARPSCEMTRLMLLYSEVALQDGVMIRKVSGR